MNHKPLVSSIIIFFNTNKFIQEAIESVFAQTYQNWELILVDDGSTDGSSKIARSYAQKYPERVQYLEHENHQNRGKNISRNLGIARAKGQYIAFLDADDIWLPHKLQQQVEILKAYPEAAMVYGRTEIWYSWTGKPEDSHKDYFFNLGVKPNTLVQPPRLLLLALQNKSQTPTTCNAIFRQEVFTNIGKFDESFGDMYEDQIFFAQVQLKAPVFVADECWAKYRRHPENCTAFLENLLENVEKYCATRLLFLNWLNNYLSTQKVKNFRIWINLLKQRWFCQYPKLFRWWLLTKRLFFLSK